jgi:hypothetical protein
MRKRRGRTNFAAISLIGNANETITGKTTQQLLWHYSAITRDDRVRSPFREADTTKATFSFIRTAGRMIPS